MARLIPLDETFKCTSRAQRRTEELCQGPSGTPCHCFRAGRIVFSTYDNCFTSLHHVWSKGIALVYHPVQLDNLDTQYDG
jgi:hypothetical protein